MGNNHPPIATFASTVAKVKCGACGETKESPTLWYDHGKLHCGCAHRAA